MSGLRAALAYKEGGLTWIGKVGTGYRDYLAGTGTLAAWIPCRKKAKSGLDTITSSSKSESAMQNSKHLTKQLIEWFGNLLDWTPTGQFLKIDDNARQLNQDSSQ